MKIGVVSDTHDVARNVRRIAEIFREEGVERIVHTGDITRGRTLEALAASGVQLFGVYGNNDVLRDELEAAAATFDFMLSDGPAEFEWAGRRLIVAHDPRELEQRIRPEHDVVLHGHIHRRILERTPSRLVFNPGECAGQLEGYNAVGIVDLNDLAVELRFF